MHICFAIWHLFYLGLTVEGWPFLKYDTMENDERAIGWRIFDGGLWLDFWSDPSGWGPERQVVFKPLDVLFGRRQHSKRGISTHDVLVPMPEGDYPGMMEVYESIWKRPRWPWTERLVRFSIDLHRPIPIPGKGENSWDIDDDAIFGLSGAKFTTVEEAIQSVVKSAMRDRERYGGGGWQPVE